MEANVVDEKLKFYRAMNSDSDDDDGGDKNEFDRIRLQCAQYAFRNEIEPNTFYYNHFGRSGSLFLLPLRQTLEIGDRIFRESATA